MLVTKMDIHHTFAILIAFFSPVFGDSGDTYAAIGCDVGWVNANNYCYLFTTTRAVTWQEAADECDTYDSSLLYFDIFDYAVDEKAWFTGYISGNNSVASAAYWTALNDVALGASANVGTGTWKWGKYVLANISKITWNSSPANDGQSNCGGINLQGKMSDISCNSRQGYICNIELSPDAGGCPEGWLPTVTDCYWVSNTTDPSQLLTWNDAKEKCTQLGDPNGHLVTIDDVNDQIFVENQLPYLTRNAYLHWTGLQRINGHWQWFNGANFDTSLFHWAVEPDNVAGLENCAVVRYNGHFSDRDCNAKQSFVCKKAEDYAFTFFNMGCNSWTRAGQSCFMFYTGPPSTWQAARDNCRAIHGDLIKVDSLDIQSWLSVQLLMPDHTRRYWTGLTDIASEGSFVWTDGTPINNSVIVWNQEPNDYKGQEDCGVLKSNGYFNDVPCTSYRAAAICELDNAPTCPTKGGTWVSRTADVGSGINCYLFPPYNNKSSLFISPEAASYCRSLSVDASLEPFPLTLDTAPEKAFILNQLKNYLDNPYGYHTSLNDKVVEGFWFFLNSQDLATDTDLIDWSGEPNNETADTDCVNINYGGYYEVNKCSLKYGFICQRPVNLPWVLTGASGKMMPVGFVMILSLFCFRL